MELILINEELSNNAELNKDSISINDAQIVSLSIKTPILQNITKHFDIKNCTPRATKN